MTRQIFLGSVAAAALTAGAAFAQQTQTQTEAEQQAGQQTQAPSQEQAGECVTRMEQVSGGDFFTGEDAAYRRHLMVLTDLRDAAMQLQAQNLDEACMKVVEAMEIAIEGFEAGDTGEVATRGEVKREELEERLVALDASEMPINTAQLEGTDLYSFEGEDIGDVEGFLMSQGKPTHMIVSHGGFWDIGDNDVAIPLDVVRWDPEWRAFFAPLTDEQLDEAPEYDDEAWDGEANDQYYSPLRG